MSYSTILNNSPMHIFFSCLSMGVAFFLGAIGTIGFGFIPIIDKQDMIYLPIVYLGFTFILLKLISVFTLVIVEYAKFFLRISIYQKLFAIISIILFFYVFYSYISTEYKSNEDSSLEGIGNAILLLYKTPVFKLFLYCIFSIILMFTSIYIIKKLRIFAKKNSIKNDAYHHDIFDRLEKIIPLWLSVTLLVLSISIGVLWIEFLRLKEPTLRIVFIDNRIADANAVVVLRANEGIIAYLDRDTLARYIPWHAVKQIVSIEKSK